MLTAIDPLFWLGLSLFLVAASLAAVLIALIPAVLEIARAARSAEKLFDTLRREFPPTLEAIRLTGMEISELTDDLTDGVDRASEAIEQVDRSITDVRKQAETMSVKTRSAIAGVKAAWNTWQHPSSQRRPRERERLRPSQRRPPELEESPLGEREPLERDRSSP